MLEYPRKKERWKSKRTEINKDRLYGQEKVETPAVANTLLVENFMHLASELIKRNRVR